jgi:hypothetical protein
VLDDSALVIDTHLAVRDADKAEGWATWSILQLPIPAKIHADADAADLPARGSPFVGRFTVKALQDGMIELLPSGSGEAKIGLDATQLTAIYPEYRVVVKSQIREACSSAYHPGERAQIYISRPAGPAGPAGQHPGSRASEYAELEFTGPRISATCPDSWLRLIIEIVPTKPPSE